MSERKTVTLFIQNGVYYAQRDMDGQPSVAAGPCVELGTAPPSFHRITRPPAGIIRALRHHFNLKHIKIEWSGIKFCPNPHWSGFYTLREKRA